MRLRPLLTAAAVVAGAAVVVAIAAALGSGGHAKRPVREHPTAIPASVRTIAVSRAMPAPSASARHLSAMLETGELPGPTTAEVLTDTNCAPDGLGISHCRNELRLPDGRTIVVRHPHDMAKVPCLAPGEQVRLVPSGV